jgi:hypothetical protein
MAQGEVLVDDDEAVPVLDGLVVVVIVVVVEFVTVRVGAVTEIPIVVDRVSVFSALVDVLELLPWVSAYAMPPPTSNAAMMASAIHPPLGPRRGRRSAPQLGQYAAPAST